MFINFFKKLSISKLTTTVTRHFCQTQTYFGKQKVTQQEKTQKVHKVFTSVAKNYDLMNDLMSFTIHRCWKQTFVQQMGKLNYMNNNGEVKVVDVAGGTGDIAFKILQKNPKIKLTIVDINEEMLQYGKKKAIKLEKECQFICANSECLPFQDQTFDIYSIGITIQQHLELEM